MRKKIVSLLLAVCLTLFGGVSVSAAESAGIASKEEQFSYLMPTWLVQSRLSGGTEYLDKFGVTREKIVSELTAHLHDSYYLGTPFVGGDWQSPNGDTSYNGAPGTNCAGFVGYVLRKCGLNVPLAFRTMQAGRFTTWGGGRPYDGLASASNYMSLAEQGKVIAYAYPSKAALLASGKCEKGDLILRFWTDVFDDDDADNHLMIFWGDTPYEDKVWQNDDGRVHIGSIWSVDGPSYIVIKFAPTPPPAPPEPPAPPRPTIEGFSDVYQDVWYAEAVSFVNEKGIMTGTGAGIFSPDRPVTRGQIVTVLWRLSDKPEAEEPCSFSDVGRDEYYTEAIDWAVSQGIVKGYGNGTFAPKQAVTRQEFAAILYRYCEARGDDMSDSMPLDDCMDVYKISDYAIPAMRWARAVGLINGVGNGYLAPSADTPRCQAAQIFMRLCG